MAEAPKLKAVDDGRDHVNMVFIGMFRRLCVCHHSFRICHHIIISPCIVPPLNHSPHPSSPPIIITIIIIQTHLGHVDAGKSTISGQILIQTGKVDKRTLAKYEQEAKEKNRESWYLSYVTDISEEERAKGKTQECSVASFETPNKRVTLLDAPGHSAYVPAMLTGAAQADIACLVISARKGEFEAGFEAGGQTTEHVMLARTMGISKLLVFINKMDESTVKWSKERYDDIINKLSPLLKDYGYTKGDVIFFPASGFTGYGIKERIPKSICSWYDGPSFFEVIDKLPPIPRQLDAPVRFSVSAKNKDMGYVTCIGKLHSGILKVGDELISMPLQRKCQVVGIDIDSAYEAEEAKAGESLSIKLKGIEEEDISQGHVLCPVDKPGYRTNEIIAQLWVIGLNQDNPILLNGAKLVMHLHTATVECEIVKFMQELNKKGKILAEQPKFVRNDSIVIARIKLSQVTACEKVEDFAGLGRFTLRDKGKTLCLGKIQKLRVVE